MSRSKRACAACTIDIREESPLRALIMGDMARGETLRVTMRYPSVEGEPTALGKARVLLESAAEVEHALLVQYLYAYFSLKEPDAGHPPGMDAAIESWRGLIRRTAIEEMGHLLMVQNLLVGIGLPPNVEREDFPYRSDLYPFNFHLDPLSERSLAKYVFAESPPNVPAGAEQAFQRIAALLAQEGAQANHVAVLYTLLGVVFMKPGDEGGMDADGDVRSFKMTAAALAKEIVPPGEEDAWHLPDSAWSTPLGVQVLAGDWGMNGTTTGASRRVLGAENREKALIALADVSAQGEGPGGTTTGDSHFARFFSIFDGTNGVVRFPGPGWEPVRPVPRDPVLPERVQGGGSAITDPVAQAWARVGDASYALLLGLIPHYLLSPAAERRHFASAAVRREMKGHLLDARAFLNERPHTAGGLDRAELPFSLPETVNLPVETIARRAALMARYDLALGRLASLKDVLHAAGRDGDYPAAWEAEWKADRDAV